MGGTLNSGEICGRKIIEFQENACYDVKQAARILGKSIRYVRSACRAGHIRARQERGGFLISGWQLRAFIEGRCDLE